MISKKAPNLISSPCWGYQRTNSQEPDDKAAKSEIDDEAKYPKLHNPSTLQYEILKKQFISNTIKIYDNNNLTINLEGSHYLNFKFERDDFGNIVRSNESLRQIPNFMSHIWGLKNPKIILPIITGIGNFKNWKNKKLEEQFQRGIIKAANKTEMWVITNGINGGISQMVGDAFNEERALRSSNIDSQEDGRKNRSSVKPLVLIGIIRASNLQNYSSFDGSDGGLIKLAGNKTIGKLFRFDLNADHSHVIIFDDNKAGPTDTIN